MALHTVTLSVNTFVDWITTFSEIYRVISEDVVAQTFKKKKNAKHASENDFANFIKRNFTWQQTR